MKQADITNDYINIIASELMGDVHDVLLESGYSGHDLERFLVRVLFCLFAEDTGIFEPNTFTLYIENFTAEDGHDLGAQIGTFFDILDTPKDKQQATIKEKAAVVLEVRKRYSGYPLVAIYDPLSMPADLLKAHRELDKVVDRAYRAKPFANDTDRLAFLFDLYENVIRGLEG